ncbi:hypothetical protein ACFS5N_05395 [Mucilaginibacter ximonensis]|uniref:Zn-dependent peptidase n=1 Tax=Mucilaginibacter ximonensis TaxID=538021 RepID=A0ABW5YAS0_9SPHI
MKILNYTFLSILGAFTFLGPGARGQSFESMLLKAKPPAAKKGFYAIRTFYKYSELRAYELTLANGVHLVFRADEGRKDILMTAVCPGGGSVADDKDFMSAMHAGAIVGNGGLGAFNGAETEKYFKQKNITLSPGIDEKYSTLKGSFSRGNIETFMQALTLYFTSPRKDRDYFKTYIANLKKISAARQKDPYQVLEDTVKFLATRNKNRVNILNMANINQIDLDKAYEIYRKCFGNAYGYTFIFTGDFKVDGMNQPSREAIDTLSKYLVALPATADSQKIINRNTEIPNGRIVRKVYNGNAPLAAVHMIYSGEYQHSDSVNLQLKVLSYLLEKNLDTLDAFSGVSKPTVTLTLNKFPKEEYAINIAFKCSPQQAGKLVDIAQQTVKALHVEIRPEQLKQYVALRKRELKSQTFDYTFWLNYLELQFMNHDDPYDVAHYPYNFHKASQESLQKAASQFFSGENYIQATLLPSRQIKTGSTKPRTKKTI